MRYIIINHGYMGSNVENWFPWFKDTIDNDYNLCVIPQYPIDKDRHFYDYWKKVLDVYYGFDYMNSDTILIGHSTGCAFTIKYLLEKNVKVDKLILVSGFNNYYTDDDFHSVVNKTMYVSDDELSRVKNLCDEVICIYGDNDPYIPQNVFDDFVLKLGARRDVIHNGGHLNMAAGYDKFEEILEYIQ